MKYSNEIVERICKHLKQGAYISSTCAAVGISKETFYEWKKSKPDFSDSIRAAMAIPDRKVEAVLLKSARGFRYKETEYKAIQRGDKIKMVPVKIVTKFTPPNVGAITFYLKNRKSDEYKDKQEHEHSGEVTIKVVSAVPRRDKKEKK